MPTLQLNTDLRKKILSAAKESCPSECCGLLEGIETEDGWGVLAVHPARNLADNPARHFLIDPQTHFEVLRSLRGTERRIIGCFHSHPNGLAAPSAKDREEAIESGFIWIVAAGDGQEDFTLKAYLFTGAEFAPVPLRD
jgi:proteasome lid subunit RPN8/RPN11